MFDVKPGGIESASSSRSPSLAGDDGGPRRGLVNAGATRQAAGSLDQDQRLDAVRRGTPKPIREHRSGPRAQLESDRLGNSPSHLHRSRAETREIAIGTSKAARRAYSQRCLAAAQLSSCRVSGLLKQQAPRTVRLRALPVSSSPPPELLNTAFKLPLLPCRVKFTPVMPIPLPAFGLRAAPR